MSHDSSGSSDASDFSDDFSDDNRNKESGDDFEFGESYAESDKESPKKRGGDKSGSTGGKTTKVQNLPFDEAVEIASDEESELGTSIDSTAEQNHLKNGDTPPKTKTSNARQEYGDDDSVSSDPSDSEDDKTADALPPKKDPPPKLTHLDERPQAATGGSRGGQGRSSQNKS